MKYELEKIDSLIETYLSPNPTETEMEVLENTNALVDDINNEISRIKKSFEERMFNLKNDKQVERYIQRHQSCLIRLCDKIIQQLPPESFQKNTVSNNINSLLEIRYYLYTQLEGLLSHIEKYFGKYFNQDENIPSSYRIMGQIELREKLKEEKFCKKCELLEIALYPIEDFISCNENISFKKLIYLKELYKEINTTCSGCKETKPDCKLSCSLLYLNFNSFRFFSYLIGMVKQDIVNHQDVKDKIECLSFHQKKLNQAHLKPNFVYKPKEESIKEQVGDWIYEELSHYEKVHQMSLNFSNDTVIELQENFKIMTDMSVSQVAYFIRLLVDTGIIQNKNQREVISFFASHIKTKKTDSISPTSFHNKYYNIDFSTKEDLKERVIKLLNETQKQD